MEWLERMQNALDHIENNLEGTLEITEVAKVAYSSSFHFQRLFYMITGMTVADYIRKRRLTLAAQELSCSDHRVLDVALKYGYDSPESFTKAFKKVHGISPTAARKPGVPLKAYPRLSFHLSLQGDKDMDYKIVEKGPFQIIGKCIRTTTHDGENRRRIPEFWDECCASGLITRLCKYANTGTTLGVCTDFSTDLEEMSYMVAVEKPQKNEPHEFEVREIPSSTWAVFTAVGLLPSSIQKLLDQIYGEWFPSMGFQHSGGPELEVYLPGDTTAEDYRCEVWIPVVIKADR
jgi:AraC family transcriptional regulator